LLHVFFFFDPASSHPWKEQCGVSYHFTRRRALVDIWLNELLVRTRGSHPGFHATVSFRIQFHQLQNWWKYSYRFSVIGALDAEGVLTPPTDRGGGKGRRQHQIQRCSRPAFNPRNPRNGMETETGTPTSNRPNQSERFGGVVGFGIRWKEWNGMGV